MKILVPLDGSEASLRAFDAAESFAGDLGAELVLCNVVDVARAAALSGGEASLVQGSLEELREEGAAIVADAVARAGGRVKTSTRLVEGSPEDAIVSLASEIRPNFIVVGSHGRTGLARLLLGSVAEGVVCRAPVPVMVVPAR